MTIDIVDLPIENGGSFHCYVTVYQAGYGGKKKLAGHDMADI